ncbi:uncharacterized protein TA09385 [Theileria annulata]|uniref:Laminin G domain-containing protein n=1 Tax=Theileria annulata TaxID=5874 RepID=Q4UAD0_THEAN|nr:uncharacterized protein TA09385 [Theileria annulata]CAI76221.1 hypothetical protein, conserved [Theileria annulata]|eukprot:XP_952846.1 hypothetical protein, conserved [Theileria annulata]
MGMECTNTKSTITEENSTRNPAPKGYKTDLINEASPEISINPLSGTIKISISLQGNKTIELTSNSKLQHHHWYHITLVRDKYDILLYINGILDMKYITKGNFFNIYKYLVITRTNKLPLYIGGAPFNNCDFPFLLDELSIFSHAIGMDEIQAEASFSLGGIESSYITIGCTNCTKEEGMISCPDGYHLCNKFELYTGLFFRYGVRSTANRGYKVARKLSLNINDIMASASAEPSNANTVTVENSTIILAAPKGADGPLGTRFESKYLNTAPGPLII